MPYNFTSFKDADIRFGNWLQIKKEDLADFLLALITFYQQSNLLWQNRIVGLSERWQKLDDIAKAHDLKPICYKLALIKGDKELNDNNILTALSEYHRALRLAEEIAQDATPITAKINDLTLAYYEEVQAEYFKRFAAIFARELNICIDYIAFSNRYLAMLQDNLSLFNLKLIKDSKDSKDSNASDSYDEID